MAEDWSTKENELIVAEYFELLKLELAGVPFVKTARNFAIRQLLRSRSEGSVEFKHQNISAVMIALGAPYVDGYKPRGNFQQSLGDVVLSRIVSDSDLQQLLDERMEADAGIGALVPRSFSDAHVPAPILKRRDGRVRETPVTPRFAMGVDYLEREARNRSLGLAGEELALSLEHERLWSAGKRVLAERIEHVSQSRGDGLGYDVASFELDGRDRLIEVKTTRFGVMTPFFASKNEVDVSVELSSTYHLYRLFRFAAAPKLFILPGSLRQSVQLDPVLYRATLKPSLEQSR